jgi:hypothetical protein
MNTCTSRWLLAAAVLAAGCGLCAAQPRSSASIKDFGEVRVDGPFTHRNLSVYVLHVPTAIGRPPAYITLAEGLARGQVKITEAASARVGRLLVTNNSDRHLFLQVGQVLSGGKQDRTLQTSFIVPPKTQDAPIPSYCVEKSRWGGGGGFSSSGIIVPRGVKQAIQSRSQGEVWSGVADYKKRARSSIAAASGGRAGPSRTSSVHEELHDKTLRKIVVDYESALRGVIDRYRIPVGLVYAVDGQISTVDVYHSTSLFRSLFPHLLKGAAAEAAASGRRARHSAPALTTVANFIAGGWQGSWQTETLGLGNVYDRINGSASLTGRLRFKGTITHAQIVRRARRPIIVPPRPVPMPRPPRPPRPPYPHPHPGPRR